MLSKDEVINEKLIENSILIIDQQFRLKFQDLIKESKLNSHKCQYMCYQKNLSLLDSEVCARNCYKPILYSKKNISILIENVKENFEKCKFTVESATKDNSVKIKDIGKCLNKYKTDLDGLKDEVEYIYKGYMKNYDLLFSEMQNENELKI